MAANDNWVNIPVRNWSGDPRCVTELCGTPWNHKDLPEIYGTSVRPILSFRGNLPRDPASQWPKSLMFDGEAVVHVVPHRHCASKVRPSVMVIGGCMNLLYFGILTID